jgi:hypothetical protein
MIEVSPAEFARMNKGLITVLKAIQAAGKEGISTRKLYHRIRMTGHGDKLVRHAQQEGYIKRVPKPPEKKGAWLMMNYLTPKGKRLLENL